MDRKDSWLIYLYITQCESGNMLSTLSSSRNLAICSSCNIASEKHLVRRKVLHSIGIFRLRHTITIHDELVSSPEPSFPFVLLVQPSSQAPFPEQGCIKSYLGSCTSIWSNPIISEYDIHQDKKNTLTHQFVAEKWLGARMKSGQKLGNITDHMTKQKDPT